MQHPARLKVAEELIIPYCNGLITADFEVEVEDAIEPIFRFGDDFQQGIEHVVFIKVQEGTSQAGASRMLEAFNNLLDQLESSILVQVTAGANFSECSNGYTHAIVARLPSGSFKLTSADFVIHSFAKYECSDTGCWTESFFFLSSFNL
ncbi:hypothetical protein CY35_02G002800 [Sphagnum magellanicum]|nr:hypothetical protein CY35_02G002800 [Sphagnum magellanicum]